MGKSAPKYRGRDKSRIARIIVEMPREEISAIDAWGIPAGMPSRTATVRHLLQKALEIEKASGQSPNRPDALITNNE